MTKNHMTCPNCNAEIAVDRSQMFVYCMYCGVKIQTQDIVEVRYVKEPESLEKMLSDGEIYYKLEDYYRAEQKFREVIKQYPTERKGYEELIRTLTRDYTIYPLTHEEEVYGVLDQLVRLISEEEKDDFEDRRRRVRESFEAERVRVDLELKLEPGEKPWEVEAEQKASRFLIKISLLTLLSTTALLFLTLEFNPGIPVTVGGFAAIGWLAYSIWKER